MILDFLSRAWKGMVDLLFLPSVVLLTNLIMCLCPASFSLRSCSPHPAACLRKISLVPQDKGEKLSLSLPTSSF